MSVKTSSNPRAAFQSITFIPKHIGTKTETVHGQHVTIHIYAAAYAEGAYTQKGVLDGFI